MMQFIRTLLRPVRRLYDWVLSWAETPYGPLALFVLSFCEASFFPIPPDPLLIALCLGMRSRSAWFAALCTGASVLGGMLGYWIGYTAFEAVGRPILEIYSSAEVFEAQAQNFRDFGGVAVFGAALTPVPYKVLTITAGVTQLNLVEFTLASIAGRGLRFFAVAGLLWWLGEPIARFIERWFEVLTIVFGVLLIGGFVVVKFLLH